MPSPFFTLTPEKNPLFVADANSTEKTKVKYKAENSITLWRRKSGEQWSREILTEGALTSEQAQELEKQGERITPDLKGGEFVEYGMMREPDDPNNPAFDNARFVAYLLIDVLLQPSTLERAAPDSGLIAGGTFVQKLLSTNVRTRARIQVSHEPAMTVGNAGFKILPNPIHEQISGLAVRHDMEITPLIPGTRYFALTLLIDEQGAWQAIEENFRTKRRKVTIQFKKFVVLNDGDEDPWGEGDEVEIKFRVYNGVNMANEFSWGPGQISDEGSASEVGLNFQDCVIGPDDFDGVDPGIGIGLYALERDYFFWVPSTDEAEYPDWLPINARSNVSHNRPRAKPIHFPSGSGAEIVNPPSTITNFEITALPIGDDGELKLTAKVRFVVGYE